MSRSLKTKKIPVNLVFLLERVTGVEPVFYPWQGYVITIIRYPQEGAEGQDRTADAWFFRPTLYH